MSLGLNECIFCGSAKCVCSELDMQKAEQEFYTTYGVPLPPPTVINVPDYYNIDYYGWR